MVKAAGALGVRAVSHVSINVSDMEQTLAFFQQMFGLEPLFDHVLDGAALEATVGVPGARMRAVGGRVGDFHLELLEKSYVEPERVVPGYGLNVMTLQVEDADAAYARACALGVSCESAPIHWEESGTKLFFLQGPDGLRIEIVEYLPASSAWGGARAV